MNYRRAEINDMDEIKDLLMKSFSPTYAYYAQKGFKDLKHVAVAEDREKAAGVITWRIFDAGRSKVGYIFWVAVDPEYRRLGIAKNLILDAIAEIRKEAGEIDIYTAVEKDNVPSRKLFESLGFDFISRSDMKRKYGPACLPLYFKMMLLPKEDLLIKR